MASTVVRVRTPHWYSAFWSRNEPVVPMAAPTAPYSTNQEDRGHDADRRRGEVRGDHVADPAEDAQQQRVEPHGSIDVVADAQDAQDRAGVAVLLAEQQDRDRGGECQAQREDREAQDRDPHRGLPVQVVEGLAVVAGVQT